MMYPSDVKARHISMILDGYKVSRKTKKKILGIRMSKPRLKRLLESVEVVMNKYPEPATILPYSFCPKCGCTHTRSTGNMVEHPELWVQVSCLRCGFLVGEADNSPFVHALECKEWNYSLH
jgi:hypothetical protein